MDYLASQTEVTDTEYPADGQSSRQCSYVAELFYIVFYIYIYILYLHLCPN